MRHGGNRVRPIPRALAILATLAAATTATATETRFPPAPCWVYGRLAFGYDQERDVGHSAKSRLEGIEDGPGRDQAMIARARQMIIDLWAFPTITPDMASRMAMQACGWQRLTR